MTRYPALAALALWIACVSARAETVGDQISWDAPLFTVEDADALDAAARLSPQQRRAVEDLLLAGMAESARITRERYQKFQQESLLLLFEREHADPAQRPRLTARLNLAYEAASSHPVDVERRTLEAVRSLLTPEQDRDGWPALESARRRRAVLNMAVTESRSGDPLLDLATQAGLDADDLARLKPIRDDLNTALDRLSIECLAALRVVGAERREKSQREADGQDPDQQGSARPKPEGMSRVRESQRNMTAEISRAFIRAAEVLPDAARAKLNRARAPSVIILWGIVNVPITSTTITGNWRCQNSLTPDQRRAIDDLAKAAWEQHLDMGVAELKWYDDAAIAGTGWNTDEPIARWGDKSRAIMHKLRADALALLTPEQRARDNLYVESRQELEAAFDAPGPRQR